MDLVSSVRDRVRGQGGPTLTPNPCLRPRGRRAAVGGEERSATAAATRGRLVKAEVAEDTVARVPTVGLHRAHDIRLRRRVRLRLRLRLRLRVS